MNETANTPILRPRVRHLGQPLGLGLPLTTVSWGSLMSMSESVLLSNCWWLIVILGTILVITLVCITQLGEYIRRGNNRLHSNL